MTLFEKIDRLEALHKELAGELIAYYESSELDPVFKDLYFHPFLSTFGVSAESSGYDLMRKRLNILNAQIESYKNFKEILKG